ncbi:MAG: HTH-type transcriptional regulator CysB [Gammaproteobacteria bacterium]
MNLQQLRYICEVERQNLSISLAAASLHTSQPGVSKQIHLLEQELGVRIFERNGKRLTGVTAPGRIILAQAKEVLRDVQNIRQIGTEFTNEIAGSLSIAATHTQARYALPRAIKKFTGRYPQVNLHIHQGNPTQIAEMVESGLADIGIATEALALHEQLVVMPCYQWNRCVVAPPGHPILKQKTLTLEAIAHYPIVTYDFAFAGRSLINKAFEARGLTPNVALTALDSDVIKTYVGLGLGIGLLARMAFDPEQDKNLRMRDCAHLFEPSTTLIAVRRGTFLRGYMYDFIEFFAPHLTRETVDKAMQRD